MVLETTLICLDNSEYARNGDYVPTRLAAQVDAANLIYGATTRQNPENMVGLLTSAGERATVQVTPTQDAGKLLQGLHEISPYGFVNLPRAVQTAQLALKHRMYKNQKQRIVLFVGSPVLASVSELEAIGKMLKKNNVALDVISFGETDVNTEKLTKLHSCVNSNNTSHFIECPAETSQVLSEVLRASPILQGIDGSTDNDGMNYPGSELDPELLMAIEISRQEETARNEAAAAAAAAANQSESVATGAPQRPELEGIDEEDEDLRRAVLLSLEEYNNQTAATVEQAVSGDTPVIGGNDNTATGGEIPPEVPGDATAMADDGGSSTAISPQAMTLRDIVSSLPGVDLNNSQLQEVLRRFNQNTDESEPKDNSQTHDNTNQS